MSYVLQFMILFDGRRRGRSLRASEEQPPVKELAKWLQLLQLPQIRPNSTSRRESKKH